MPGTLFVVATPIGNLEDITPGRCGCCARSTLIAAEDTRRTAHLLARYAITTPTTSLHEHNERRRAASLVARLERGETRAGFRRGNPDCSDPGSGLSAAIEAGFASTDPGPSAAWRPGGLGPAQRHILFLGFPPTKSKDRTIGLRRAEHRDGRFLRGAPPNPGTLSRLQRTSGDRQVAVGRELTKAHEELVRGPISEVSSTDEPRGSSPSSLKLVIRQNLAADAPVAEPSSVC